MTLKRLPEEARPRERLQQAGARALSSVELLAIVLGNGTRGVNVLEMAQEILSSFGGLECLTETALEELQQVKGLGIAKAVKLKAALELGMRAANPYSRRREKVSTPAQVYSLVKEQLQQEKRELFITILLDVKGYVIAQSVVSIGTLSQTLVHPREVFYAAIKQKAAAIILAHNHPSGDATPSNEDISVTEALIEAGKLLEIPVHDHVIIGESGYVSLREMGCFGIKLI